MENSETTTSQHSTIMRVFISTDEPRLRAGWRLLLQSLLLLLIGALITVPLSTLIQRLQIPPTPILVTVVNNGIPLVSITASVFIARRLLDRRTITSLGLKIDMHALEDVLAGFLIPALMVALVLLLERVFGWVEIVGFAWGKSPLETVVPTVLIGLGTFIVLGWQEELLSRGYYLQNLEEGLNLPWAVLLSPFVFGAIRLYSFIIGYNSSIGQIIMVILGILVISLFFAYAYLRTRQLWLPIGLHIGWNFFAGTIYGYLVSGSSANGLVLQYPTGPELITGGAYGPEAGLILLPALALGLGLVFYVSHGREVEKVDGKISHQEEEGDITAEEGDPTVEEGNVTENDLEP